MQKGRLVVTGESVYFKVALACFAFQFVFRCVSISARGSIIWHIPFISDSISYISFYGGTEYSALIVPVVVHDVLTIAFFVLNLIGVLKAKNSLTTLACSWFVLAVIPIITDITTAAAVASIGYGDMLSDTLPTALDNGLVLVVISTICCALTAVLLLMIDRGTYKVKYVPALCVLAVFLVNYGLPLYMYISAGYFFYFLLQLVVISSAFLPTAIILLSMYNLYTSTEASPQTEERLNPYMPPVPYEQEVTLPEENNDLGE